MSRPTVAVSAPGKVLLAGGFLVLDRQHTGLVFALDARIHVHVVGLATSEGVVLQEVVVRSPQFTNAQWRYGYHAAAEQGGLVATQLKASSATPNPFVETALTYTLTYVSTILGSTRISPAIVTILADNDYYSQTELSPAETSGSDSASTTSNTFRDFGVPLEKAHKTGLGSSAALVTAFVAALLSHYLPPKTFHVTSDRGRRILHNLAQVAHSAAQGKVGSGFDVASAVFGSCVYRRFSPQIIDSIGEAGTRNFSPSLVDAVEEKSPSTQWDMEIIKSKVSVPHGLRLVMCDVDCGSKTPGMVKKVLAWRKAHAEDAARLWTSLQSLNDELAAELTRLSKDGKDDDYTNLGGVIERIRTHVRDMSRQADVPIEPDAQTNLLNACTALPGVVGGVAPGAGGYDAVALLIEDTPEVLASLSRFVSQWMFQVDDPGVESTGRVRMLGVREEMEGLRVEDPSRYRVE